MIKSTLKPSHNPKFHSFVRMLSARIQGLRRSRGISMEELANSCGVTRGTIHKIENHEPNDDISFSTIWTIARHFDSTLDDLIRGIDISLDTEQGQMPDNTTISLDQEDFLALSLLSELAVLQIRADIAEQACLVAKDEKQLEMLAEHSAKLRQKRYSLLLKKREN